MLYVASSIHHQSLNRSWISLGVSEEGNYQKTVDWGQAHMGTLQPGLHMLRALRRLSSVQVFPALGKGRVL